MKQSHKRIRLVVLLACTGIVICVGSWKAATLLNWNRAHQVGQEIDRHHGVIVYYNGGVAHTEGRNLTPDGYNLGIRYQCVEFVKRYYFEQLGHRMPDTYGHAKHFFDPSVSDGGMNLQRDLLQFTNGGSSKPQPDDLIVFAPTLLNRFGHVAIVSEVAEDDFEIVQQNPGPFGQSRERLPLRQNGDGRWSAGREGVWGWLRKADPS